MDYLPLIKSLLLPELREDLDSIPIEREHFKSFHECLEKHLPLLYDNIQQHPKIFLWGGKENDIVNQEIQAYLVVLLCEITSPNAIYKLNRNDLIHNAERILQNFRNLAKEVDDLVFKYYEENLHKDKWKKQLGAIHGFANYLELRFSKECELEQRMSQKFIMFCLSVALNIRSCYEIHYKVLSTSIFIIIMRQMNKNDIISMNIHGVIYDAVYKDIYKLDNIPFIVLQWNCLIKCLDFYDNFDSFSWNYVDDMMEILLRNISLAPDSATSICLLKVVNQLIIYFTIDRKEFDPFFTKDLSVQNINDYRLLANSNTSFTCYRWAKSILQMFVIESYKLMQGIETAKQILQEIHKIYVLSILPIRLSIVEPHLITFLDKFIAVLMETLKVHKYQDDIMTMITSLLETFNFHLQNSADYPKLHDFKQNICALLQTDLFKKYVTV